MQNFYSSKKIYSYILKCSGECELIRIKGTGFLHKIYNTTTLSLALSSSRVEPCNFFIMLLDSYHLFSTSYTHPLNQFQYVSQSSTSVAKI